MPFSELELRTVRGGMYQLLNPLVWHHPVSGKYLRVPTGFITDLASIPRGFRWLITGHDGTRKPAVVHDYLYRYNIGTRKDADLIFRACMRETGVPAWKREAAYLAVRLGGRRTWNKLGRKPE